MLSLILSKRHLQVLTTGSWLFERGVRLPVAPGT
jgi:hypothetical protein